MEVMTIQYKDLSDEELVGLILQKGNEEAMLYILFEKYDPLLKKLCKRYYNDLFFYEQLQTELYILLKADDWRALRSFGWRSTFGRWLGIVAGNLFIDKMHELIGISKFPVSIGEDVEKGEVNPPEPEPSLEHDMNMILLIEAIQRLEDKDQRFIILREFDGYHPKEIARQLENYRRCERRLKTRKLEGGGVEEIIPSAEYVHMLKGRAKPNLRIIINELKKEFKW